MDIDFAGLVADLSGNQLLELAEAVQVELIVRTAAMKLEEGL